MAPFPLKLPAEVVTKLQTVADQMGTSCQPTSNRKLSPTMVPVRLTWPSDCKGVEYAYLPPCLGSFQVAGI
jgi:hypothetical protein